MKNVILFATDDSGGAGKAALRIVKALNRAGRNCKLVVKNKHTNDDDVVRIYSKSSFGFSRRVSNYLERKKIKDIAVKDKYYYFGHKYDDVNAKDIMSFIDFIPDTVVVTWMADFLSPRTVREFVEITNSKLVLYPMDMSLFTGGCHYAWDCNGFEMNCQQCPAIVGESKDYVAVNILKEKKIYWGDDDVCFWACSSAIYSELKRSSILGKSKLERMFIPIDENTFNSRNTDIAKRFFDIESTSKVILFGSSLSFEERKGISFFVAAVNLVYEQLSNEDRKRTKIILAGRKQRDKNTYAFPFEVIDIDFIKDDLLLSHLYQAADVLVCPSIQDSGPMMINEAQMCGLPVVAFRVGVAQDFIVDGKSGYVCEVGDVEQLANSLIKVIVDGRISDRNEISVMASEKSSYQSFANKINIVN